MGEKSYNQTAGHLRIYGLLIIIIAIVLGYGIYQSQSASRYMLQQNASRSNSYANITYAVSDITTSLESLDITDDNQNEALIYAEIYRKAGKAQEELSNLPYSHNVVKQTSTFLNQVSDFAYSLLRKELNGYEISENEKKHISTMQKYAIKLENNLNKISSDIEDGNKINWDEIEKEEYKKASSTKIYGSLMDNKADFDKYEEIEYDGNYSSSVYKKTSNFLEGKAEATRKMAEEKVMQILGKERVQSIKFDSIINKGDMYSIEAYRFYVSTKSNSKENGLNYGKEKNNYDVMIDISKKGLYLLDLIDYGNVRTIKENIKDADARNIAKDFLIKNDYENMELKSFEKNNATMLYHFCYKKDGIMHHDDLIDVKVSLNDKAVIGFDARSFIMNHKQKIDTIIPSISMEEARNTISKDYMIQDINLSTIVLNSVSETLCYEINASKNNKHYKVFVNANTGLIEKISKSITADNGEFII